MYTHRKKERRSCSGKKSFPLIEKGGRLVEKDRRSIPDRRLGDIHLELADRDHGYPEYFFNPSFNHRSKKTA
jgi:hypothetical protein